MAFKGDLSKMPCETIKFVTESLCTLFSNSNITETIWDMALKDIIKLLYHTEGLVYATPTES